MALLSFALYIRRNKYGKNFGWNLRFFETDDDQFCIKWNENIFHESFFFFDESNGNILLEPFTPELTVDGNNVGSCEKRMQIKKIIPREC